MYIPPFVMYRPKSRIILQISHPRPVLSGQLTVIQQGSPGCLPFWITTTSSFITPIPATA